MPSSKCIDARMKYQSVKVKKVESQPVKVIGICFSAISIFSSLGLLTLPVRAEKQQVDFTTPSRENQSAETKEIQSRLKSNHQTFAALLQEAELLATRSIEQGFAESPTIKEISVSILGERDGQEAPLLLSRVSRSDWQKQPSIQKWTKYFSSSAVLLGFLKPQVQESRRTAPATSIQRQNTSAPATSIQQDNTPAPSANSIPVRANLEPSDPGFR